MIAAIMLTVQNLTKSYRSSEEQLAVLRGVDLELAAGESVALTGESGSGKSTLLHLIAGLDKADSGEIWLDGAQVSFHSPLEAMKGGVSIVHQELSLAPNMNLAQNIYLRAHDQLAYVGTRLNQASCPQ